MSSPCRLAFALAFSSALLLASGCGGGGSSAGSAVGPTTAIPGTTLGTRGVPGYGVTAATLNPVIAGGTTQVRIRVQPDTGVSQPASVDVWAAGDYAPGAATIAATPAAGSATDWLASIPIPASPVPGLCAWVRLTLHDGAVIEVGKDFPLP